MSPTWYSEVYSSFFLIILTLLILFPFINSDCARSIETDNLVIRFIYRIYASIMPLFPA